ncbi:TrmH family RNA methyltransferase [Fretibacter rubidus]|uniref:TrmH family RNA methyltransferase n=1 Tax=Fretibacter rubidus TaxID=570162 RepID=UPI00352ABA9D
MPQTIATPKSPKKGGRGGRSDTVSENRGGSGGNRRGGKGREGGAGWIWGNHACVAALSNPKRTIHQIMMTEAAAARIAVPDNAPPPKIVLPGMMDRQFDGSAHQGIAMKCAPLEWPALEDILGEAGDNGLILVLDQITDPHNVGAMLRLCSAFGVDALVMQDRKSPPLSGATAKVAVGCIETVPVCLVTNVANTLLDLQKANWMVTGLAGETELSLGQALSSGGRQVIVMGAEGPGLRDRVRKSCDQLARIPMMSGDVVGEAESLNVATAAAIALYEARRD